MYGRFEPGALLLHVTRYEGRSLEQLLVPSNPGDSDPTIGGAVVEAPYVATDPPLLVRFKETRTPWFCDPLSVRFASDGFLEVPAVATLPYAPRGRLSLTALSRATEQMVERALRFQADHEPSSYLVPALPVNRPSQRPLAFYQHLHHLAADICSGLPHRPLFAAAYPSLSVLRSPFGVFNQLMDRSYAGVYVRPTQLAPRSDSVGKLATYARFLLTAKQYRLAVIAGGVGTFGLILTALGVDGFDTGLGEREGYSLARLERPRRLDAQGRPRGGRMKRVYLAPLLTSLSEEQARVVLHIPAVRTQFICEIGECKFRDIEYQAEEPRRHFLHSRQRELEDIRQLPTVEMKVQHVHRTLTRAVDLANQVNRLLESNGNARIDLQHLDRWSAVLSRMAAEVALEVNR